MGLFDRLLAKPESTSQSATTAAPHHSDHGPLSYDPELIPHLVQEHNALLRLFGEIKKSYESKDFMALKRALQKFQLALTLHLDMENAKFYAYLRAHLTTKNDPTVADFRDEMQAIGQVVTQFLGKYNHADFTPEMLQSFGHDLGAMGTVLMNRIKREEDNLFRLYSPSAAR